MIECEVRTSNSMGRMGGRAPLLLLSILVHACRGDGDAICRDGSHDCPNWAQSGNCESNAIYMAKHCRLSCKLCEPCKPLKRMGRIEGVTALSMTQKWAFS